MSSDEFVCGACFGDQGLKDFCLNHAESRECDFCGATDSEPIAAPLDEVIEHINSCIHWYFDDPANAGLAYESAEGGYQGTTYYTYEVFNELDLDFPKDKDSRLYNAISDGVDNYLWSEVDPYGLSLDQQLHFSWEQFCHVIKHERRYFFLQEKKRSGVYNDDELFSPAETLRTIFSFAEEVTAFTTMPAGTRLYRARRQPADGAYKTAGAHEMPSPTSLAW